eukprot:6178204-Pleurochrysis_carterae.AAC.2
MPACAASLGYYDSFRRGVLRSAQCVQARDLRATSTRRLTGCAMSPCNFDGLCGIHAMCAEKCDVRSTCAGFYHIH